MSIKSKVSKSREWEIEIELGALDGIGFIGYNLKRT